MEFIDTWWPYAAALLPTLGVAFLFYWIIKYMIEGDRRERQALARWNAEQKAKQQSSSAHSEPSEKADKE